MTNVIKSGQRTEKVIVARGHSIDVPLPSGEKVQVGLDHENKPVTRVKTRLYREGEEVELPVDEIASLRTSGFLVDPDNLPPPAQESVGPQGPRY